jgi:hypothetical protein
MVVGITGSKRSPLAIVALSILGIGMISSVGAIPTVHAGNTITINDTTSCGMIGGSWSGTTCTLTTSYTSSVDSIEIPSTTTLLISGTGTITILGGDTFTIDSGGSVNVENSGTGTVGMNVYGGAFNSGTINVENLGNESVGINVEGFAFTNSGIINIENSGTVGIVNGGEITNSGTINVENSGIKGILNDSPYFTNSGTIDITNSGAGSYGIWTDANILNSGIIDVENSGAASYGIFIFGATITNECSGTITVENTLASYGIDNDGTIINRGTIRIIDGGSVVGNPITPGQTCLGIPQFPVLSSVGPLLLIGPLLPALFVLTRKFRK